MNGLDLEGTPVSTLGVAGAPSARFVSNAAIGPDVIVFRENRRYVRLRRAIDIAIASLLIGAALPILAVAALAIIIDDGAPILFRQRRVGRFGRLFTIYKLRTMRREQCVDRLKPTSGRDPRITRVGYWLRKLSIDELPQLFNVLFGDMTMVGPRPEMPFVVRQYAAWQHLRHLVTPGVTGHWQTTVRSTVPLHLPEATMIDLEHVRASSHSTDATLIIRTISSLISAQGAH